jgi:hypothetical protein
MEGITRSVWWTRTKFVKSEDPSRFTPEQSAKGGQGMGEIEAVHRRRPVIWQPAHWREIEFLAKRSEKG